MPGERQNERRVGVVQLVGIRYSHPDDGSDEAPVDGGELRTRGTEAVEDDRATRREREMRQCTDSAGGANDKSKRGENGEERKKEFWSVVFVEPEDVDGVRSALDEGWMDFDNFPVDGVLSLDQVEFDFLHETHLPCSPLHHCLKEFRLSVRVTLRCFDHAYAGEELFDLGVLSEHELRVELADGEIAKVGVDETQGAEGRLVEAGVEDDE